MFLSSVQKKVFVILFGLICFFIILILPTPEEMNPKAQRVMAVTVLVGIWWIGEGTHISATALLPLVLFPILGIISTKQVALNYANHLTFLFLGGFMIALSMEKWDFHKRLAMIAISKIGTKPSRIVFGFMAVTAFLSMWISNTATAMMMLPVAKAVVNQIAADASLMGKRGNEVKDKIRYSLGLVLMLGIAYSASVGGVGTLIGTPPNMVFAGFYKNFFPEGSRIEFFQWMVFALPLVFLFLPIIWIYLCYFVTPVSMHSIRFNSGDSLIQKELKQLGPMSRAEKYVAVIFFTTVFLWVFRESIPLGFITITGWSGWFYQAKYLFDSTVAITMGLLLFLIPLNLKEGVEWKGQKVYFVLDWKTVEKGVPWGVIILFGGGLALGEGFRETGLDLWIGSKLAVISDWPQWLIVLIVCMTVTFLTEFTSNTATIIMILPVLASAAAAAEINPILLMIPATFSASFAFMLPVATPPNAIVFSSGWVSISQMAKAGLVLNLLGAIFITCLTFSFMTVVLN